MLLVKGNANRERGSAVAGGRIGLPGTSFGAWCFRGYVRTRNLGCV